MLSCASAVKLDASPTFIPAGSFGHALSTSNVGRLRLCAAALPAKNALAQTASTASAAWFISCRFMLSLLGGLDDRDAGCYFAAYGPTSGLAWVSARLPNSALAPRAIAAISLPAWKQVKSGLSFHASGPHNFTPALIVASWTM